MEKGLSELKKGVGIDDIHQDLTTPVIEHCGTYVTMEDDKYVVSAIPVSQSFDAAAIIHDREGRKRPHHPRRRNVSTQTTMKGSDVEEKSSSQVEALAGESEPIDTAENRTVLPFHMNSVSPIESVKFTTGEEIVDVRAPGGGEECLFDLELSDDEDLAMTSEISSQIGLSTSMPVLNGRAVTEAWAARQYQASTTGAFSDTDITPLARF